MMFPPELKLVGYLPRTLAWEITLMKSDASSLPFINTSLLIYLFSFLFLTNILLSFKKRSMVLKQNHSKNLRVLYCYFLSDGWEWKTFDCSRPLIASSHTPHLDLTSNCCHSLSFHKKTFRVFCSCSNECHAMTWPCESLQFWNLKTSVKLKIIWEDVGLDYERSVKKKTSCGCLFVQIWMCFHKAPHLTPKPPE